MSKFVGRTLQSLNSILNNSGLLTNDLDKQNGKLISWYLDLESFVKKLKCADSLQAESSIINSYITAIQSRLSEPSVQSSEVQEMIKICMICEGKGHKTPFIYVHCLKLAQKGNLQEKHTGYLASAHFLNPHHELIILLVNTIQKDLSSSNYMEVLCALTAVCNSINSENVHNVLSLVEDRLCHVKSSVRKSAILTLGHCLHLINSESAYKLSIIKIEKLLSDNDLDVVSAAVCIVCRIVQILPDDFSYLIDSLIQLQDQILLRRIPKAMIYSDIPAPWLQLDILKFLKILCKTSDHAEHMTPILKKTLQQGGLQTAISYAIIYQTIETILNITPNNELIEIVMSSISAFLKSKHVNLKLIGIEALTLVVRKLKTSVSPSQQEIVMECLKLSDTSIQLKTLDLLCYLANSSNVQAICKKLMEYLMNCSSEEKKKELAMKILQLCKKFTDRKEWFVSTIISVLLEIGSNLPSTEIYDIINIISKDKALQEITQHSCIEMAETQIFPSNLIKLTASVINLAAEFEQILPKLLPSASEEDTSWILISLTYAVLKTKHVSPTFINLLKSLKIEHDSSLEILAQLLKIVENHPEFGEFIPADKIDPTLSFLDDYVINSMEESGQCYQPYSLRITNHQDQESAPLSKTQSYTESIVSHVPDTFESGSPTYSIYSSPSTSFQSLPGEKDLSTFSVPKRKNVWTEEGRKSISESSGDFSVIEDSKKEIVETDEELSKLFAGLS